MQIQKIQSNNTSFGYNPLVNAQLMNDLAKAKKNKAYCKSLRALCSITNQLELDLRKADKKGMPDLKDKLARVFLPIKVIFTDMIDSHFPNYNYKRKELETYAEEVNARNLQDNDKHWLTALVTHLQEDIEDDEAQQLSEFNQNEAEAEQQTGGDFLSTIMSHLFPGAVIVSSSTMRASEVPEEEVVQVAENANEAQNNGLSEEQAEFLKRGKDKVVEFVPKGSALKGFDGLGGMKELKAELTDKVVDFLRDPEQAKQDAEDYGTKLPKGLLLYGPPGCGKTTIVKHLSVEADVPLLQLETGRLKTSYYHETSKNIDAAFEYAYSIAKPEKPVIMMIDDGDSFFVERNEKTSQFEGEEMTTFLNKIQEAPEHNVMVALTTNKYDIMDPAIRRRFDTQVYVGLPDEEARKSLLKLFFSRNNKSKALSNNDEAISKLAKLTENFPISALEDMANRACDIPKKEAKEARKEGKFIRRDVTAGDFETILTKVESQNQKIKEDLYKTKATRPQIGFNNKK